MADAIVRLRVESSGYDQKLSRATQQLQYMEKEVRRTGATFAVADKEELAFIKSLGSMETKANSAKGKIAEMTNAFTELSLQYNRLSKEEKNSPFGKAMADSIGQIKGRIGDLGGQLNDVGAELKTTGGFIDTLADGLGQLGPVGQTAGKLLKGAFGPVGIAIAAVVGVIKQVVEAFKRNEDAMAGATRAAAPFKAIWQQIQRLFDRLVPHIVDGMEKISSGMQSMFSKITDWMGKLSNTAFGKKLGLDKVYEQLKKVSSAQAELTESNKQIADSENALKSMRRSTETGNAQRRAQISELRFKATDKTNYSAEERVGFLEKALELEGKTLRANIALREKEYELIKLKNSLTNTGTEDLDAENDALNAITDARTEYNNHIRETQSQLESARKELEKEVKIADTGTTTTTTTTEKSNDLAAGSIAAQEKLVQELTAKWKGATDETRDGYKAELDAAKAVLDEMIGKTQQVGNAAKTASDMWSEHTTKIAEMEARLNEFKEMVADTSLTDAQRDWAAGMAEQYQSELDKMKGATEEAVDEITSELDEIPSSFEMFKDGVGAVGSLVGSLDNLKKVGDDLTKVFSGEMDAWDALMTVFNSGIGIMQTVVGMMEAINTLTELGTALKAAHAGAATAEATTVVSAAGTEVAAEGAVAAASGTATAAKAGEAAAGAGSAVSSIPIVGPILAVAAIAAVIGAVMAAVNKSKSANSYSTGGMVGGNSPSGDNVIAWLNSGEGVLTANGVNNAKTLAEGSSLPNNLHISTEISGTNLRIVLDNDNRSKGGSRGAYSRIK